MRVDEFDYYLPPELIAQHPSNKREASKMMVLHRHSNEIEHKNFHNIEDLITPDDLIVINNTKVIPARIFGKKETGANIEIFLIHQVEKNIWECLLRPQKRVKPGINIILKDNSNIKVLDKSANDKWIIKVADNFEININSVGNMPLPPYIKREQNNVFESSDRERYQTVYAKIPGAVAAPTAGLHFTPEIINRLKNNGSKIAEITLHVGLGTFKPVKTKNIEDHIMHKELYSITETTAELINEYKAKRKRVISVGTTTIRTLESVAQLYNGTIKACSGWSNLFIYPGFDFKVTDACITNFHLPKSTLIMLVSALAGKDFIFHAYNEAIKNNYRFYSYGDCMFIS